LQELVAAKGNSLNCHRRGEYYVCNVAGGLDLARASLFNGGSKVDGDATDDYRQQEAHAKQTRSGIWK